jgi:hypothetical protein
MQMQWMGGGRRSQAFASTRSAGADVPRKRRCGRRARRVESAASRVAGPSIGPFGPFMRKRKSPPRDVAKPDSHIWRPTRASLRGPSGSGQRCVGLPCASTSRLRTSSSSCSSAMPSNTGRCIERMPVDGVVLEGHASVDQSLMRRSEVRRPAVLQEEVVSPRSTRFALSQSSTDA